MELRHLRHFLAVAEHASFGRAAKAQHITQPALSKSIRQLERELGDVRLFDRLPDGVKVTPFGTLLMQHASLLMNDWRLAREAVQSASTGQQGSVTIGTTQSLATSLLAEAQLRSLRARPDLRVNVITDVGEQLVRLLLRGAIDFYLGPLTGATAGDAVQQEPIFRDRVTVVARARHPIFRIPKPSLHTLREQRWVLYGSDVPARRYFNGYFSAAGLEPPAALVETNSAEHSKVLIRQTDLLGYLPYCAIVAEHGAGSLLPVAVEGVAWKRLVGIGYRNRVSLSPAALALIGEIRNVARTADFVETAGGPSTRAPARKPRKGPP